MHEVCLKGQGCAKMTRVRDLIKLRENLHSRGWREDSREAVASRLVSKTEIEIDFFSRKYKQKMHTVEMSNHQDK